VGTFHQTIQVGDFEGERFEPVDALVDTGATYTWLPRDVLERLGVQPQGQRPFVLADGREVEYGVAWVRVRIDGQTEYSLCIFGEPGTDPLLGVFTLEAFGLGVDPVNRKLVPVRGYLTPAREAPYRVRDGDYVVSTDRALLDIDAVHAYLSRESYWAAGISREQVQTAIDHSLPFGLYHHRQQIGFARAITDFATFAYLADVFVLEQHRGRGLGKLLLRAVLGHPRLQRLRRWMLGTRDAHGLYAQFGFIPLDEPQRWMELPDATAYTGTYQAAHQSMREL
jgi:clan AA aspartic protease